MKDSPSCALFAGLKRLARITNAHAAHILLDQSAPYGGRSIAERLTVPSFLSREIVHARPGALPEELFAPFGQSARSVLDTALAKRGSDSKAIADLTGIYLDRCVPAMQEALDAIGADSMLFRNGVERVGCARSNTPDDRLFVYLVLYIATGCLGDPVRAVEYTESFASDQMLSTLSTVENSVGTFFSSQTRPSGDVRLGLLRVIGNSARPPLRPLADDRQGTVIGSLASDVSAITDVDSDVSREHLRIWKSDGRWFAQGLGSTNGSTLLSGADRSERMIEPPRTCRSSSRPSMPVEIKNGDTLCLGATTRFLVIRITD